MRSVLPLGHGPAGPLIGVEEMGVVLFALLVAFALILYRYNHQRYRSD